MRRSPRLHQGENAAATRAGNRPAAGPAALPVPQTPHHPRRGAALDNLVRKLDDEWQLGLSVREPLRSPAQNRATADKIYTKIQHLFYSAGPALDDIIQTFAKFAPGFSREERLNFLLGMLRSQTPISRIGTPISAKNVPPKSLLSSSRTAPPADAFLSLRREDADSHYTTAPEPGSSTDEDEDFETPPPSPTPSSRSAPRRMQIMDKEPMIFPAPSNSQSLFKKPSLDMARSFQAAATTTTTTSSTNTSFNASVSSSQQSRADTVNTSFTSYDGITDREVQDSNMARTSSTTIGSLDNRDLLYVGTKLESSIATAPNSISLGTLLPLPAQGRSESPRKSTSAHRSQQPSSSCSNRDTSQRLDGSTSDQSPGRANESPSRTAYYIREIPGQNLFVERLPDDLRTFPFFMLFIVCRVSLARSIPMSDLIRGLDPVQAQNDPAALWSKIEEHPRISKIALRDSKLVWAAARKSFEGFSFKGKLVFNSKSSSSKSVFNLELQPIQAETSCQLQRQFGSDRFLYLTVPPFHSNKPGRFTYEQMKQIHEHFQLWLLETHQFLGRLWRVFHIQPIKRKGESQKQDDVADMRLVLFAIEGIGIRAPLSIGQMLNEFIPFEENMYQNYIKFFTRLDLGLSKTTPTLTFKPSQIKRIRDTLADGEPEASTFNDPRLSWTSPVVGGQVMNDGCSRVSVGAALMIWNCYKKATGSDDPLPSALQGRIGGAKGMWIISGEPQTRNTEDGEIWIEITDSQLKFQPPWEDRADERPYNKHRLTFNLLKYSHATGATDLHISFIPILVYRGVHKDVIAKLMVNHLDEERQRFLEILSDPVKLYNWITKQGAATTDPANVLWQGALPQFLPDKIKFFLRSGFNPREALYLANVLTRFMKQRQAWMEQKLRAPLGKATFMYGVADPSGVLRPGEVHIQFSTPFADEYTGNSYRNLNGLEVLLARQPACRESDIQKVRVVSLPELSHLVDVVVFPVQGEFPLAGKLQGGDYDGDIFWTCWEDCLVEPFRNAPAPMAPIDPAKYGIKTDNRKLHEVMTPKNLSTVDNLLKEVFKFRTMPSFLGIVTNLLEKVAYHQNRISSNTIGALCDVHDQLVDGPKQGYIFTQDGFKKLQSDLKCGDLKKPAYKEAMEANAKAKEEGNTDEKTIQHNPQNILDYLFFDVFHAHNVETMNQVSKQLSKEEDDDPGLRLPFLQLLAGASEDLKKELHMLVDGFGKILDMWNSSFVNKPAMSSEKYCQSLVAVYNAFRALLPSPQNACKPDIAPLLYSYFSPSHPTMWDMIRASALYTIYPKKVPFVWHMGGRELAHLKARSLPGTYDVVAPIFANLKPKPIKAPKPDDDEDEELSDEDFESAMEQITS